MNRPLPRDGVLLANGLSADFRFVRPHANSPEMSVVETAHGHVYVLDSLLTYDPIRDLSPEAAAVVADEQQVWDAAKAAAARRVQDGGVDQKECNGD